MILSIFQSLRATAHLPCRGSLDSSPAGRQGFRLFGMVHDAMPSRGKVQQIHTAHHRSGLPLHPNLDLMKIPGGYGQRAEFSAGRIRRPQILTQVPEIFGRSNFGPTESDALRFEAAEDSRGLPSAPKVGCVILKAAASAQGHNRTMPHNAGASRKQCPEHRQRHQIWFGWRSAQSWAQCPGACILRRSFAGQ